MESKLAEKRKRGWLREYISPQNCHDCNVSERRCLVRSIVTWEVHCYNRGKIIYISLYRLSGDHFI